MSYKLNEIKQDEIKEFIVIQIPHFLADFNLQAS